MTQQQVSGAVLHAYRALLRAERQGMAGRPSRLPLLIREAFELRRSCNDAQLLAQYLEDARTATDALSKLRPIFDELARR